MSELQKVKLDSSEIAFCIKTYENSPVIGLYIPTLMSEIKMLDSVWERNVNINSSILANRNPGFSFDNITIANYYKVGPYDPAIYYAEVNLGEQVRIKFLENDIKKCYYYDDTYKMTDALMENTLELQKQIDELNFKFKELEKRISQIEGDTNDNQ